MDNIPNYNESPTPLRDQSRERKRQAWLWFAGIGTATEIILEAINLWKPWNSNPMGKGIKFADKMLEKYIDKWERDE